MVSGSAKSSTRAQGTPASRGRCSKSVTDRSAKLTVSTQTTLSRWATRSWVGDELGAGGEVGMSDRNARGRPGTVVVADDNELPFVGHGRLVEHGAT